jgi:hypothetical protein
VTWTDDTGYIVFPFDGVNGVRRNLLARIGLSAGCRMSGAGKRSGAGGTTGFFARAFN